MNESLLLKLKSLGLHFLLENWEYLLKDALLKKTSYSSFIKDIIEKEYNAKMEKARLARIKRASMPQLFVLDTFPFEKQPKLDKKIVYEVLIIAEHRKVCYVKFTNINLHCM